MKDYTLKQKLQAKKDLYMAILYPVGGVDNITEEETKIMHLLSQDWQLKPLLDSIFKKAIKKEKDERN